MVRSMCRLHKSQTVAILPEHWFISKSAFPVEIGNEVDDMAEYFEKNRKSSSVLTPTAISDGWLGAATKSGPEVQCPKKSQNVASEKDVMGTPVCGFDPARRADSQGVSQFEPF
jgi:hypothetical protein